jgi:hypothetical protein
LRFVVRAQRRLNVTRDFSKYKPASQREVELTPDEFLCLAKTERTLADIRDRKAAIDQACATRDDFPRSERAIESYRTLISNGRSVEIPFLDFNQEDLKIAGHEGRHRATIARQLGITEIPTIIFFRDSHSFIDASDAGMEAFERFREEGCRSCPQMVLG